MNVVYSFSFCFFVSAASLNILMISGNQESITVSQFLPLGIPSEWMWSGASVASIPCVFSFLISFLNTFPNLYGEMCECTWCPLTIHFNVVKMVNFTLCLFYYNIKEYIISDRKWFFCLFNKQNFSSSLTVSVRWKIFQPKLWWV